MKGGNGMNKKGLSKWNIEHVSDPEIYDAIRYLEPDRDTRHEHNDTARFVLLAVAVIVWLAFLWCFWFPA
jgi:hypothetical protein